MDRDDVISTLNDLIETSRDGEEGFRQCAETVKTATLKTFFEQKSERCREAVTQLLKNLEVVLADQANAAAFERDFVSRERMNAELNLAFLDAPASTLPDTALVSLATFSATKLEGGAIVVNGVQLKLEPLGLAIVAALQGLSSLRVGELGARIANASPDATRRAVLELARHDVVTIQT